MMTPAASSAWAQRRSMVEEQVQRRGVTSPDVLAAMRTVPRHLFVAHELAERAYEDGPLSIGDGQTISQPYVVAAMSEALEVGAGERVLEVGTGSGYQAAVLAELASEVYTVERVERLAEEARDRFARLCYENVRVRAGDGALGWPEAAPFQGILVACGAPEVPQALLDQLAPGGRMVVPVGAAGDVMKLVLLEKDDGSRLVQRRTLMPVRFVPLVR